MNYGDARLPDRFWSKVVPEPNSGCWLWTAHRNAKGYGCYGVGSYETRLSHRVAFQALLGLVPDGLELDHRCKVRCCCNPAHLEPVSHAENVRRGETKKSHCKRGHALAGDNLMPIKHGAAARCRLCVAIAASSRDKQRRMRSRPLRRRPGRQRGTTCTNGHQFTFNGERNVCLACQSRRAREHATRKTT